jgi:hypothetical protein
MKPTVPYYSGQRGSPQEDRSEPCPRRGKIRDRYRRCGSKMGVFRAPSKTLKLKDIERVFKT